MSPMHLVGGISTLAAAGAAQGTATLLSGGVNVVTSATADTECGVRFPTRYPLGVPMYIVNATNVPLNVFPATGGSINGGVADAAVVLLANLSGTFVQYSDDKWGANIALEPEI